MNDPAMPQDIASLVPFAGVLGIEIESASGDEVRASIQWRSELCTAAGVLHGGAMMAFADTVGALCAFMNMAEGSRTATIESKTNFFRAVTGGAVQATTRPLHKGRQTIVVQTNLENEGKLVAQVTQTQAVIAPS